ncbi:MAG: uncharacterized protein C75L2_00790007 [Leptospirillum sp. Group II 'C75']|jgi:predicted RNA binding protein YcfA (HicA-like mRNA interferase family)|uniref:YcfA family protein n=1 Tax=Leptospirillum sp. Group II '5-way CG' TaxID=419541 RepID=B6AQ64_9BACT|nr:type II toxin-antitoxin system HicA family toxin [Leptospirillum sp. Group II 'CF-1']AKS22941.1 periplasmic or secreted lipoprotein [Leptospirillum sp. Group II 'CF-1']EAY57567.1 MAG: conserved protein of unknown function [Leptospirillum rubarum]EDZ38385.1 MAG: Conserved protein of unknown function [Leptospirillum sp. Group II '5-way CG']EIJ76905.1 MAG: uncharacterized protein C75L2_00790007 [Leptospirillum sp. Group II 'C75']
MKAISGKDFIKMIEEKGWKLIRIKGSHHVFGKEGEKVRLVVPVHGNRSLKTGLLNHLSKLAGIAESDLT